MNSLKNRAALVAVVFAMTAALSACGGNPIKNAVDKAVDKGVEKGVEKVIENAAGDDVDINVGVDGSEADLPSSFPSGIPLPDGAKLISSLATDEGWSLSYMVTDTGPVNGLVDKYKSDSSWTTELESISEGFSMWNFKGATYGVVILASGTEPEESGIIMTVIPVEE